MEETSKYKNYSVISLYKRIFKYAVKSWPILVTSLVLMIIINYLSNIFPIITKNILDDILVNKTLNNTEKLVLLKENIVIYAVLFLLSVILRYVYQIVFTTCSMKLERDIRFDAMDKLNKLKIEYFDREPDGKIVTRINNDVGGLRTLYQVLLTIIQALINIVIVYSLMYSLDKRLAIYTALVSPFILLWIRYFRKIIFRLNNSIRELNSKINAKINELVTGVSVIQIFNKEETMLGEYNDLVLTTNKKQFTLNITNAVFGWELLVFIKRIGVAFIILYFGLNFMSPETVLTSGLIYAFIAYIDRIIEPINQIFNNINSLEDSKVAANRILTFLDEEEDFTSKQNLVPESLKSDVVFKDLTFSYIEGIQVLKNINLTVKNGEQIGIVGHTGSGKSSLMNLLCLFYNYKDGEILINNENISNYNKHEFRKKIGIVLQTPQLFKGTIKDNITMNDDSYSDEFLYSILEKIGALDIVDKYERRIYTEMSFKGDNLSVGEKQLISFARILLKNPDILILDEATANIDTETELKIKAAMNVISKNRTTFIIAHRLSTIKNCDRIIVLDKGKIVGVGKHEDLYINCNEYRKIHDSQYNNLTVKKA